MSLMATARALDDEKFVWRVKAACMNYAADHPSAYASRVLDNPHDVAPSMLSRVALDDAVAASVTVDGTFVDTSSVPDSAITAAVAAAWDAVAANYQ